MAKKSRLLSVFRTNAIRIRHEQQATQGQVAKRLGITQASYSRIESGKQSPNLKVVERIALALSTTVVNLLTPID